MNSTKRLKTIMSVFYIVAALFQLLGILFMITHWDGAITILIIGLILQVLAFAINCYHAIKKKMDH